MTKEELLKYWESLPKCSKCVDSDENYRFVYDGLVFVGCADHLALLAPYTQQDKLFKYIIDLMGNDKVSQ